MRKWAIWCFEHKLGWLILLLFVLSLPVYLLVGLGIGVFEGTKEAAREYRYDLRAVLKAWRAAP